MSTNNSTTTVIRIISTVYMALLFLSTPSVHAEMTVEDLSRLQSETLLLKANAQKASAQNELDTAQGKSSSTVPSDALPMLISVYGVNNRLFATFSYPDGRIIDAYKGERLPNGYTVGYISVHKVVLHKGRTQHALYFSAV